MKEEYMTQMKRIMNQKKNKKPRNISTEQRKSFDIRSNNMDKEMKQEVGIKKGN